MRLKLFFAGETVNIYVGNLPYSTTQDDLRQYFEPYGTVQSTNIIQDRETGRSKGFGFVVMPENAQAQAAIAALNDKDLEGRKMKVNEARPREERPPRGDRGDRGGGGGDGERRW